MSAEPRSMCRDLFRAFMQWCGFLHQDEVKEGFLSREEVKKDFMPRADVKKRLEGMQPRPISLMVLRTYEGTPRERTIITRIWRSEDVKLCKLCKTCEARYVDEPDRRYAECMFGFPGHIDGRQLPLYADPDLDDPTK